MNKRKVVPVVLGVAVLGILGWNVLKPGDTPKMRELQDATITEVDAAAGMAEIEFRHPKTGELVRLAGTCAPECEVLLDNQAVTLADLEAGDRVHVKGQIHYSIWTMFVPKVEAHWVHATRPAPATQTAATTTTDVP